MARIIAPCDWKSTRKDCDAPRGVCLTGQVVKGVNMDRKEAVIHSDLLDKDLLVAYEYSGPEHSDAHEEIIDIIIVQKYTKGAAFGKSITDQLLYREMEEVLRKISDVEYERRRR